MTGITSRLKIFALKKIFNWKWINFGLIYSCPSSKSKSLQLELSVTKSKNGPNHLFVCQYPCFKEWVRLFCDFWPWLMYLPAFKIPTYLSKVIYMLLIFIAYESEISTSSVQNLGFPQCHSYSHFSYTVTGDSYLHHHLSSRNFHINTQQLCSSLDFYLFR